MDTGSLSLETLKLLLERAGLDLPQSELETLRPMAEHYGERLKALDAAPELGPGEGFSPADWPAD